MCDIANVMKSGMLLLRIFFRVRKLFIGNVVTTNASGLKKRENRIHMRDSDGEEEIEHCRKPDMTESLNILHYK